MQGNSRENNINLLRLLAACAVVYGHCPPIALGPHPSHETPGWVGLFIGEIAVHVFFVLSGLLVARSAEQKGTVDFLMARIQRIYPGAVVSTIATVVVLGLFFSTLSPSEFFLDPSTARHLIKNTTLLGGIAYDLPGVFTSNPIGTTVNGSLWTIGLELKLYGLLAIMVAATRLWRFEQFRSLILTVCVMLAFVPGVFVAILDPSVQGTFARCILFFLIGAGIHFIFGGRVPGGRWWILAGVALMLWQPARLVGYAIALPPLVIWLAYAHTPIGKPWARWPDLSYGIYLYAFPVQQAIAALMPGLSSWTLLALTMGVLVPISAMSWYWVESPFLRRVQKVRAPALATARGLTP